MGRGEHGGSAGHAGPSHAVGLHASGGAFGHISHGSPAHSVAPVRSSHVHAPASGASVPVAAARLSRPSIELGLHGLGLAHSVDNLARAGLEFNGLSVGRVHPRLRIAYIYQPQSSWAAAGQLWLRIRMDDPSPVFHGIAQLEVPRTSPGEVLLGCPGHCQWGQEAGSTVVYPTFRPSELADVYSEDEFELLRTRIEEALQFTTCPTCPGFVIGLGVCWYLVARMLASQQTDRLTAIMAAENARLAPMGLRWQSKHVPDFALDRWQLVWFSPGREEWEADHPRCRRISQEPYPARFFMTSIQWMHSEYDRRVGRAAPPACPPVQAPVQIQPKPVVVHPAPVPARMPPPASSPFMQMLADAHAEGHIAELTQPHVGGPAPQPQDMNESPEGVVHPSRSPPSRQEAAAREDSSASSSSREAREPGSSG